MVVVQPVAMVHHAQVRVLRIVPIPHTIVGAVQAHRVVPRVLHIAKIHPIIQVEVVLVHHVVPHVLHIARIHQTTLGDVQAHLVAHNVLQLVRELVLTIALVNVVMAARVAAAMGVKTLVREDAADNVEFHVEEIALANARQDVQRNASTSLKVVAVVAALVLVV